MRKRVQCEPYVLCNSLMPLGKMGFAQCAMHMFFKPFGPWRNKFILSGVAKGRVLSYPSTTTLRIRSDVILRRILPSGRGETWRFAPSNLRHHHSLRKLFLPFFPSFPFALGSTATTLLSCLPRSVCPRRESVGLFVWMQASASGGDNGRGWLKRG